MALITATALSVAGTALTLTAVNASDTVVADDDTFLLVTNGGGGSINVTISDGGSTPAGNPASTTARAVAAGATRAFPLTSRTNDQTTGVTTITYSGTTSVTAGAFRV
jgi:hypothetical protein